MKKFGKGILIFILVAALALFAFGCAGKEDPLPEGPSVETPPEEPPSSEPQEKDPEEQEGGGQGGEPTPSTPMPPDTGSGTTPSEPQTPGQQTQRQRIRFGSYPQSEVKEEGLKAALNAAALEPSQENGWNLFAEGEKKDQTLYKDIEYASARYRGVYYRYTRGGGATQIKNGYPERAVYWFKFEPIEWEIVESTEGTMTLLSVAVLDALPFGENNVYADSAVRAFLNGVFAETAFGEGERGRIRKTTVDNSAATTASPTNPFVCENTSDDLYLPSYADMTDGAYYSESSRETDDKRVKETSDYAACLGTDPGYWWLRSPYHAVVEGDLRAYIVYEDGYVGREIVTEVHCGVCPMLRIGA